MDVEVILSSARDQWLSKISRDLPCTALSVRAVPDSERAGFKLFTFSKWFQVKSNVKETFWYNLSRPNLIFAVARYRMGSHWLSVETGRFEKPVVLRSKRLCKCCNIGCREDELHMIYCPFYTDLRYHYNLTFHDFLVDEDAALKRYSNGTWCSPNAEVSAATFWKNMGPFIY